MQVRGQRQRVRMKLEAFAELKQENDNDGRDDDREAEKPDAHALPIAGGREAGNRDGERSGHEEANHRREQKVKSIAVEEKTE